MCERERERERFHYSQVTANCTLMKYSFLKVRVNNPTSKRPLFTSGLIGRDNSIARHGIHGLYWLYNVNVPGAQLVEGENTIFFTQPRNTSPFQGLMYDYIRLEGPPPSNVKDELWVHFSRNAVVLTTSWSVALYPIYMCIYKASLSLISICI